MRTKNRVEFWAHLFVTNLCIRASRSTQNFALHPWLASSPSRRSRLLFTAWQRRQSDCRFDQRCVPPSRSGVTWSTCLATAPHFAQLGCPVRYARRILVHVCP